MEPTSPKTPSINPTPAKRRGGRKLYISAICLIVIGAGIISYPFWPKIQYALSKPKPSLPYQSKLINAGQLDKSVSLPALPVTQDKPIPRDNWLVIPSINVDAPIHEGTTQKTLDRGGIWHLPNTSNPLAGGNMVLSGHRWQYLPPSNRTLYLLDKVQDGEPVIVYWQGVEYDYRIARHEVVDPSRTDIMDNTPQPRLTIFTCTPLFSTKYRLVLYGELIT